jgi:hypothetical protein
MVMLKGKVSRPGRHAFYSLAAFYLLAAVGSSLSPPQPPGVSSCQDGTRSLRGCTAIVSVWIAVPVLGEWHLTKHGYGVRPLLAA